MDLVGVERQTPLDQRQQLGEDRTDLLREARRGRDRQLVTARHDAGGGKRRLDLAQVGIALAQQRQHVGVAGDAQPGLD